MREIRYFLKHGDPTSTGGALIAIRPDCTHEGVGMGIEGDVATCPACNSSGPAFNDCYPGCDYHGTQQLVNGARVYCQCAEPPRVFNTQSDSSVEVESGTLHSAPPTQASLVAFGGLNESNSIVNGNCDEQLQVLSSEGIPLARTAYHILMKNGSVVSGITDEHGRTQRICTREEMEIVQVEIDLDGLERGE